MKPYFEDESVTIYHSDCRDVLPTLDKVDLVLTDPPYGDGWPSRGGAKEGTIVSGTGEHPEWDKFSIDWIRLLDEDIPIAAFCSVKTIPQMMAAIDTDKCLFYIKTNPSPIGSSVEACVVRGYSAAAPQHFLAYNAFNGQQHPTQKPIEVIRWVAERAPAGTILDPFMGSGTTLRAAKDLNRKAIGIEISEKYCEIAAKRMSQLAFAL